MRVIVLISLVLVIVAAALIAIQAQNSAGNVQTNGPVTVEGLNYPLKLAMTLKKTNLTLGEPLDLAFSLENVGNETLTLIFSCGRDAFDYAIYNESDALVYSRLRDWVFPQIITYEYMRPNETRCFIVAWPQFGELVYVGLHNNPPCYYDTVPPGTYSIRGAFRSRTLNFTLETAFVEFKILG
jgi:hypothetical protein